MQYVSNGVRTMDITQIAIKNGVIHLAIVNILDHVKNPSQMLGEIYKILRIKDTLIISGDCSGPLAPLMRRLEEEMNKSDPSYSHHFCHWHVMRMMTELGFNVKNVICDIG